MSQIPYAVPPRSTEYDLPAVATYQRCVNYCILGYILGFVLIFALPQQLKIVALLVVFASQLAGLVCVILLAAKLYKTSTAVLYGIGMIVPLVNLIVLLAINGKATKILKANGYTVGLLGAK